MAEWVRGFVIPEVGDVHLAFEKVIRTAEQLVSALRGSALAPGAAATLQELRAAFVDFNDGLRFAAQDAAQEATRDIRLRLKATQVRPDTGVTPSLDSLVRSAPLSIGSIQTGMVGVGDVSELERAINPRSPQYGTFWRAQEFGTGASGPVSVPSQIGRVIFGYFMLAGGGDPTPPQSQYAGGGGPHPIFQSGGGDPGGQISLFGHGKRGGRGGIGTIGHEIRPRLFITLGADAAAVRWQRQIDAVQSRALDRLAAIGAP